jgi:hypothetical protein
VRLLIAETGAESLGSYLSPGDCEETIVLRQYEGESPIELSRRASARISNLESARDHVAQAVIAMSPGVDPQLMAARHLLGLTILSHVQVAGEESELVLAVDENAVAELRRSVIALVESLVAHPGSRNAPIRVRFVAPSDPPRRESGVYPSEPAKQASSSRVPDLLSMDVRERLKQFPF